MTKGNNNGKGKNNNKSKRQSRSPPSNNKKAKTPPAVTRLDDPGKSPADGNNYRIIELQNGIRAALISTREADPGLPSWHHHQDSPLSTAHVTWKRYAEQRASSLSYFPRPFLRSLQCRSKKTGSGSDWERIGAEHKVPTLPEELFRCGDDPQVGDVLRQVFEEEKKKRDGDNFEYIPPAVATVALIVNAGSIDDPKGFSGMSHFLEHVVHAGSEKYPDEDAYMMFIAQNKGIMNAFTQLETTTFHFSIEEHELPTGLDMFASMLREPKLDADYISREVQAIDNEYFLRKWCDYLSVASLTMANAREDHQFSNVFTCGTEATLFSSGNKKRKAADVRNAMAAFHKKNYVGSGITLAVQGSGSLDSLEDLVVQNFGNFPAGARNFRKDAPIRSAELNPFDTDEFRRLKILEGRQSEVLLFLTFSLPPEAWKDFNQNILQFISFILEDNGPEGLQQKLIEGNLVTSLNVVSIPYDEFQNNFNSLFDIVLTLPHEEVTSNPDRVEEDYVVPIITEVLSYFQALHGLRAGAFTPLYEALRNAAIAEFNFSGPGSDMNLTIRMARFLQLVEPDELLTASGGGSLRPLNEAGFKKSLDNFLNAPLSPILVVPQREEPFFDALEALDFIRETDDHSSYAYYWKDFDFDLEPEKAKAKGNGPKIEVMTQSLTQGSLPPNFVPEPLPAIPTQILNITRKAIGLHVGHPGGVLRKSRLYLIIRSNFSKSASIVGNMKIQQLKHQLVKSYAESKLTEIFARNFCKVGIHRGGTVMVVKITGYAERFTPLVREFLESIFHRMEQISETDFEQLKDQAVRSHWDGLSNMSFVQQKAIQHLLFDAEPTFELDNVHLQNIGFEEFRKFAALMRQSSFAYFSFEGNISVDRARQVFGEAHTVNFHTELMASPAQTLLHMLPFPNRTVRIKMDACAQPNATVRNYYQLGMNENPDSRFEEIVSFLFAHMQIPSFSILRSQKQLGYSVQMNGGPFGSHGLLIIVEVTFPEVKHNACAINKHIDDFFLQFEDQHLNKLNEEQFMIYKDLYGVAEDLSLGEVRRWFRSTFGAHIQRFGDNNNLPEWTDAPARIRKLSVQTLPRPTKACQLEGCRCQGGGWYTSHEESPFNSYSDHEIEPINPHFIPSIEIYKNFRG